MSDDLRIPFSKMHGLGNDFVVIDATSPHFPRATLTSEWFLRLSDRHRGVGCDQILIVEPPRHSEQDFYYGIYNRDGSPSGQCGNGARCFALFVHRHSLSTKSSLCIGVPHGNITIEFIRSLSPHSAIYRVNMGAPIFDSAKIPFLGADANVHGMRTLTLPSTLSSTPINIQTLSMGNPHAVLTVDDVANAPVSLWGSAIERHPDFPSKVNVGFMSIQNRHSIHLRVFERGAGETLACGSGACAAVVAGIQQGALSANVPINVRLPGGSLSIQWGGNPQDPVWMEGLATSVFDSSFPKSLEPL